MAEWIRVDRKNIEGVINLLVGLTDSPKEAIATIVAVFLKMDEFYREPDKKDMSSSDVFRSMAETMTEVNDERNIHLPGGTA